MKFAQLSKSMAVAAAIAAPLLLTGAAPAFAVKPPFAQPCKVGSATYPTIQSAVDQAGCGVIKVPAGTYNENLLILRDVEIRGAGPDKTLINGIQGPVIRIASLDAINPVVPVVTLKGLTITGGKPSTVPEPSGCIPGGGGGIDITQGAVTVEDAFITGNTVRVHSCMGNRPGQGGGINSFASTLTVRNSVISDNIAERCGGIRIGSNVALPPSVATIIDTIVADNVADGAGSPFGRELGIGGGMCITEYGRATLDGSSVSGNSANVRGGGIHLNADAVLTSRGALTIRNSTVSDNTPDDVRP